MKRLSNGPRSPSSKHTDAPKPEARIQTSPTAEGLDLKDLFKITTLNSKPEAIKPKAKPGAPSPKLEFFPRSCPSRCTGRPTPIGQNRPSGHGSHLSCTHRPLSSSFLGLPCRILNVNHKKELLRGLWVGRTWRIMGLSQYGYSYLKVEVYKKLKLRRASCLQP